MEKILRIEETTFQKEKGDWQTFEGFQIVTDKQKINLGICNSQSCCENWGYFISNDDIAEFTNSDLLSIEITNTALNTKTFNEKNEVDLIDEGSMMFVNIVTNKGLLQFVAYNEHDGYYGHDAIVMSNQLNFEEIL